jgi:outer membrane receptor protein involved in Fe transport
MPDNRAMRIEGPMERVVAWLAVAAAACGAAPAATQATAADELQAVVVTASRRVEARLEFNGSVSGTGRPDIELVGATHAVELLNRSAGVYMQRGSGQENLTAIRSPVLTGAGACGAFLVLEDNMPIRPIGFCNVNQFFELNLAQAGRIEVVRGPGTVAFGANAVHGIVNVLTPAVADLAPLQVGFDIGSDSSRRINLEASAGAFGVYGHWTRDPGWRAASGGEEAKLNLAWDGQLGGATLRLRAAGTVLNQETAGFVRGLDAWRDPQLRRSNPNPEAFRDAWSTRLSGEASWQHCEGCSTELRLAMRRSEMQFLQHFLLGKPLERNGQDSVAVAVTTLRPFGDSLRLRAGADLEWSDSGLLEIQDGPTLEGSAVARAIRPAGRHYDYTVRGSTAGAFVDLRWQLAPRWSATTALRAEQTRYRYDNLMIDGNTDEAGRPCAFGGCLFSRPADRSDRFDNVSPRAELAFAPDGRQRYYLSAGRGFRPPETTELYRLQRQQSRAALDSENLDSIELGWSGQWRALRADVAAFSMRKRGVIIRDSNGFNIGDGRTTHAGVEYQFEAALPHGFDLALAGTLARHRYDFSAVVEGGETIVAGRDIDTAPRTLHNLRLGWRGKASLRAELEVAQVGRYFVDASNTRGYGGHWLAHLRVAGRITPAVHAGVRIINVFDQRYADRADFAQGEFRYFPGAARSVVLDLEYRFGGE